MLNLPHQTSFGVENNLHVILWPMNSNFIFTKNHKIHYSNLFSHFFFLFLQLFRPSSCQNGQFVRICGQYPNRYLSYGPCPEDTGQNQQQICSRFGWRPLGISCRVDSDCFGRQFAGLNTARAQCDRSQCCAPPLNPNNPQGDNAGGGAYIWWDTCENGGYFTGQNCRTTRDCGQGQNGGDGRWAQYEQICLQGECCTTIRPSPDSSPNNNNGNLAVDRCAQFGGRRIRNNGCIRHSDCNILVGRLPELPRIEQTEQIICQQSQCCLMPRTLPIGFTNWAQACPQSGGRFLGMFCEMDQRDCQTTADNLNRTPRRAICELRRYCCATDFVPNDQQGNGNLGCEIGDRPVGSQCRQDSNCLQGEYCGNQNFCCLRRGNDDIQPRPDTYPPFPNNPLSVPAFCYNGQQSLVPCRSQIDCKQMTQACVNGLCCTRTGDEWKNACGGAMAVSSCFQDRSCHDSLVCTSADYCCECPFGQAAGKCTNGCPPNYSCISGGEYCCPRCPGGDQPFGSCYNGKCGTGYICSAGNICCRN